MPALQLCHVTNDMRIGLGFLFAYEESSDLEIVVYDCHEIYSMQKLLASRLHQL